MDRSRNSDSMSSTNTPDYDRSSQDAGTYPYNGKVLLAAVILLSVVVFFVILLHVYTRWFLGRRPVIAHAVSEPLQTTLAGLARRIDEVTFFSKGLDAKVVASLPVFVCEKKEGGDSAMLDCVVCLSAMEEGEVGRMLPRCKHVFHVECIDMWLGSHSTCPICRDQVKGDESGSVAGDGAGVVVEVVVVGEESGGGDGEGEGNVTVELPLDSTSFGQIMMKGDESSSSSSSSSLSCSLKRMVSKSRSESRVFPSVLVN